MDPLHSKEIATKIDYILCEDNFYFYNTKGTIKDLEDQEMRRLLSNCLSQRKSFIKDGCIEKIYTNQNQRTIIIEQF